MSNLAIMMQRAGLFPPEEAAQVREFAQAQGISAVEAIVQRGLATEPRLVEFLQSKLMIPKVDADLFAHIEPETTARLSAALAWAYEVVPVSVDDVGNLTLAMADPTDLRAVDAIAHHTGAYLVRAVASLTPLRNALEHHYGPRPQGSDAAPEPHATLEPMPAPTSTPAPAELEGVPPVPPPSAPEPDMDEEATTPLPPPPEHGSAIVTEDEEVVAPLSPAAFARVLPRLVAAADRDEITRVLLDFLAEGFSRVIMFVHTHQQLRGRDARGEDLLPEAVSQVRIPTTGESHFHDVVERQAPHFGPWRTSTPINQAFDQAMGGIRGNVLLLPVRLRDRVPLLVYASGTHHPVDPRSLNELVDGVSSALERLIFRRKSQDNIPKVE